jgi:voltage-gated potassium channel
MSWFDDIHNAIHWGNSLRVDLTKSKQLGYLVLLATIVTSVVGVLLFLVDPNIHTPIDGIWSAWVTMTHVGYGDVVPVSFFGRLLAAGLILVGLVFFSLFTALVSVSLIGKNIDLSGDGVRKIEAEVSSIYKDESQIIAELARLQLRMEEMQKLVLSSIDSSKSEKL